MYRIILITIVFRDSDLKQFQYKSFCKVIFTVSFLHISVVLLSY